MLYFPMGEEAAIQQPKSPVVHLLFDHGSGAFFHRTIPLSRREDGVWLATIPLTGLPFSYAIYWIEDRETKQLDTNHGKYFEIPFCDVHGRRTEMSVKFEAQSYTGLLEGYGIERAVNYAKAIDVLEEYIHVPSRGQFLISSLWTYKLYLHEDTPEARSALLAEINKFINDHSVDGFGLIDALNFAAYQDWIPSPTMESLVKAIEHDYPKDNPRAFLLSAQVAKEKDKEKRIALQWEIVDKYPDSLYADDALKSLMLEVKDLSQREKLYQQIRVKDPDDPFQPINMAKIYLEANQKLPEALALLDEGDKLFDANVQGKQSAVHYPESVVKAGKSRIAIMRADILVRLGKPDEALAILLPRRSEFTLGSSYFILGKAFEDKGDKKSAIDAYLEATVRPSGDQQQANAALQRLWLKEKLGNERDLQQRIEAKSTEVFSNASYVPQLLRHASPDFDLITIRGEHLTSSQLRGKKVILHFWAVWCSPCLWELNPLQEFQEKHPEVVLLTLVDAATDAKDLEDVVHKKKLTSLRISRALSELWEKFGSGGVPNTFVIDESGYVRVEHLGVLPDVSRYLGADLRAITEAVPANELGKTGSASYEPEFGPRSIPIPSKLMPNKSK